MLDGAVIAYGLDYQRPDPRRLILGIGDKTGILSTDAGLELHLTRGSVGGLRCAAEYVAHADLSELVAWKEAMKLGVSTQKFFEGVTLCVDDASPDTCLTLIILKRRLANEPFLMNWVDYAARWEQGDVHTTGAPESSWGALHSALVHPFFDRSKGAQDAGRAVEYGMAYITELMNLGLKPEELPAHLSSPLHLMAQSRLAAERQRYLRLRDQAPKFQLAVPLVGSSQRRIVDALLMVESVPTGAIKAWLRRDTQSYTGDGYAVLGVYRPGSAESGPEISISVDPLSGVSLRDLWVQLERSENAAWLKAGLARPSNAPRAITSFKETWHGIKPTNEPWWDDYGRYTFVGSPRRVSETVNGTLLSWTDVINALWDTYGPHVGLNFAARAVTPTSKTDGFFGLDVKRRRPLAGCPSKWFVDLVSEKSGTNEPPLWTPTLEAACAAYISAGDVDINRLPGPGDFDVIKGRGGIIIVNHDGTMFVETSENVGFPVQELKAIMAAKAETLTAAIELEQRVDELKSTALRAARSGRARHKREALTSVYGLLLLARQHVRPPDKSSSDPLLKRFEQALENRWDANTRFQMVIASARDLETMVVSSSEIRAAGLLDNIAIYGFPAMVFGNILGAAFSPMASDKPGHDWNIYGVSWPAIAIYCVLTIVVTAVLSSVAQRVNRRWQRGIEIAQAREPHSKPKSKRQ